MSNKTAKKQTAKKAAEAADNGEPIYVYYKGERLELKIVNSVVRRYKKLMGTQDVDLDALQSGEADEDVAIEQMFLCLMAALKLEGSVEDHEDYFEPLDSLGGKFQKALQRYKNGTFVPGEPSGDVSAP